LKTANLRPGTLLVELLLNRGLRESTAAVAMAGALEGRTLGLRIEGTPIELHIRILGGRFHVTAPGEHPADAGISGTLAGLGRLLGADPEAAVRDGMMRMTGDADVARAFRELLHEARPDLERELARFFGPAFARDAAEATRSLSAWSERAALGIARDVGDYLTGASRLLVTRAAVESFARDVDELVDAVARAEARIQKLEAARGSDAGRDGSASRG
jgi:ubiquinone biosynthesis protein UbiJ